jgi:putative intracellular protease/amidase
VDSIAQRTQQTKKRNVAIFIHNGVEVLDFAGPSEVFAATQGFNVYTVSLTKEPIISQGFIRVLPTYSLTDCPHTRYPGLARRTNRPLPGERTPD